MIDVAGFEERFDQGQILVLVQSPIFVSISLAKFLKGYEATQIVPGELASVLTIKFVEPRARGVLQLRKSGRSTRGQPIGRFAAIGW